jgi:hypothetical protein
MKKREFTAKERSVIIGCLVFIVDMLLIFAICLAFCSCGTQKELVPVVEQRTEHHWHTDSVKERDSVHTEHTTVVRELDSAAMAQYGIQLRQTERAWLVQSREMELRLRELERMTATRDTVRDSIPVPVPVEVVREVPAPLSAWQQFRMRMGNIFLGVLGMLLVGVLIRLKLK